MPVRRRTWSSATSAPRVPMNFGSRHPIRLHLERLAVSGRGDGCLEPPGSGLGDGHPPAHPTGAGCAGDGYRAAPPEAVIHHSDHGSQYTSLAFGKRCREGGIRPSMGSVGDCFDNAMCESFFATLECELLDRETFSPAVQARRAVFTFIEGWYNPHRLHSALGYVSPIQFERSHTHLIVSPSHSLSVIAG